MLGLPGDGTCCNHCIVFYLVLSPLPKDPDAQNPAWLCPSCAARAQASTGTDGQAVSEIMERKEGTIAGRGRAGESNLGGKTEQHGKM